MDLKNRRRINIIKILSEVNAETNNNYDVMHYFYWLRLGSGVKTIDDGNVRLIPKESAHN